MGQAASTTQTTPEEQKLISDIVIATLRDFETVRKSFVENSQDDKYLEVLDEAHARFKIWANNIAAARKGAASLDHRLRDASHIRTRIVELLTDIQEASKDLVEISSGERIPWDKEEDEEPSDASGSEEAAGQASDDSST